MLRAMRATFAILLVLGLILVATSITTAWIQPIPQSTLKLYVFDCGTIAPMSPQLYNLKVEEISANRGFITPCYLIVHSRGTLMWDVGQIPDANFPATGGPATQGSFTSTQKLLPQLAAVGYKPSDITYLALSHYHSDHTANANEFAGSTWIVQEIERTAMFAQPTPRIAQLATYSKLKDSKTVLLHGEDRDVFGDGTVVIKSAPGHTPGHQVLFLKLAKTGPVLLAGDLYHFPEERTLDRVPTFDTDAEQTRKTRKAIDEFLKQTGAQLWIEHDIATHAKLPKAPQYVD
ncbi:MAG TPA: N-acyl homoserine lactonase family protein [Terriglobia bacterium]|nr:N-acyl homoserine lactonase family protein [Terriglobia bacterium]